MSEQYIAASDIRHLLKEQCVAATSQSAWARQAGVSPQYLSDVLTGKREPGPAILKALNIEQRYVLTDRT